MQAVICERYGPPEVLRLTERPRPVPRDNEVLVRTQAATVTQGDCEVRSFRIAGWIWVPARLAFGILRPRQPVLGMEIAGEVVEVGSKVTNFSVGDRVFGSTGFGLGGYAEYVRVSASAALTRTPDAVSQAQAAGIPTGGFNGLHFVRRCRIEPGERVLVNGAAGSIGMFAVQLAKLMGAEVTGVDRGDKLDMLRNLGADQVIDYQREDFTASGKRYDVIIDVVGKTRFSATLAALTGNGRYFLGNPRFLQMMRGLWNNRRPGRKVLFQLAGESVADLDYLKDLVASKKIAVVIDRSWPLADIVAAHRYVEAGNKKGIVVIEVAAEDQAPDTPAPAATAASPE